MYDGEIRGAKPIPNGSRFSNLEDGASQDSDNEDSSESYKSEIYIGRSNNQRRSNKRRANHIIEEILLRRTGKKLLMRKL